MAVATPTKLTTTGSGVSGFRNNPLRTQVMVVIWVLVGLAVIAFLAAISTTNARIQTFQKIAAVAVPSINATNDAIQLLSGEVSNTAEYILAGQGRASAGVDTGTSTNDPTARKQAILKQIEAQRAAYDRALQEGYTALTGPDVTAQPNSQTSLNYISSRNARLHDALAQARGLADSGKNSEAVQAYLNGQNDHYQPVISSLYYLRGVNIFVLEDAEQDATNAAALQQTLAAVAMIIFVLALAGTNIWLTLRVKRVLLPLVNVALLAVAIYSIFLWSVFSSSANDLAKVVESYNRTSLSSDANLFITDAVADQVQLVISTDAIYKEDLKKKQELLLAARNKDNALVADSALLTDCPTTAAGRSNYKPEGVMGDVCRNISQPAELAAYTQFLAGYKSWLTTNNSFGTLVDGNKPDEALALRAGDGAKAFKQMSGALTNLRDLSKAEYRSKSKSGTDSLNLANTLAWAIYPLALLLAGAGLFLWRREF